MVEPRRNVLLAVGITMRSQRLAGFWVQCDPANSVELVITEYALRCTAFAHGANEAVDLDLFRAAINQITDEDCCFTIVAVCTTGLLITHPL